MSFLFINEIISKLNLNNCKIYSISLICSEESLKNRIKKDIENGLRNEDILERSLNRLEYYNKLDTIKIDVSDISAVDTAKIISKL